MCILKVVFSSAPTNIQRDAGSPADWPIWSPDDDFVPSRRSLKETKGTRVEQRCMTLIYLNYRVALCTDSP